MKQNVNKISRQENKEFLKRVYSMSYDLEKSLGGDEKKAKDFAKKMQAKMKWDLRGFDEPVENID